ncbi:ABC transporter permease [Thermomonas brevis]
MSTVMESPAAAPRTAPHTTHKLKWLLRREFWEHKGGFLWAPVWAGGISLLLTLMALIFGEVAARRSGGISINGLDLRQLTDNMSPAEMARFSDAATMSLASAALWPLIVLGFVVFFYCLGTLYDERKDRSVLFWKSLPVSDRDTVLSKLASALLVAPAIAVAVGAACMVAFLLMVSVFAGLHGVNPLQFLQPGRLLANIGLLLAMVPVYALWALPTAGWLMLCSAAARSKPFLWAIMIPVFTGIFITWFDVMNLFQLESGWFWKNIVARGLLSVFPGTWVDVMDMAALTRGDMPGHLDLLRSSYGVFATPQMWIGAAAGIAMILAAIRLRRWRDEG